jgi:hypothetical protein
VPNAATDVDALGRGWGTVATARRKWRRRTARSRKAIVLGFAIFVLGVVSAAAFAADVPLTEEIVSTFASTDDGSSAPATDSTGASVDSGSASSVSTAATASGVDPSATTVVPSSYIVTFAASPFPTSPRRSTRPAPSTCRP